MKRILLAITAAFIFALVAVSLGGCSNYVAVDKDTLRGDFAAYLGDKYGFEFVVDKPYMSGFEGAKGARVVCSYAANAHPKDKESAGTSFLVKYDGKADGYPGYDGSDTSARIFRDGFLDSLWSRQAKDDMDAVVKEYYGENASVEGVEISHGDKLESEFPNSKWYSSLDYSYASRIFQSDEAVRIRISVLADADAFDKKAEAGKAYEAIKTYMIPNIGAKYSVEIYYVDAGAGDIRSKISSSGPGLVMGYYKRSGKLVNYFSAKSSNADMVYGTYDPVRSFLYQ